jgi:hypothetical protein
VVFFIVDMTGFDHLSPMMSLDKHVARSTIRTIPASSQSRGISTSCKLHVREAAVVRTTGARPTFVLHLRLPPALRVSSTLSVSFTANGLPACAVPIAASDRSGGTVTSDTYAQVAGGGEWAVLKGKGLDCDLLQGVVR